MGTLNKEILEQLATIKKECGGRRGRRKPVMRATSSPVPGALKHICVEMLGKEENEWTKASWRWVAEMFTHLVERELEVADAETTNSICKNIEQFVFMHKTLSMFPRPRPGRPVSAFHSSEESLKPIRKRGRPKDPRREMNAKVVASLVRVYQKQQAETGGGRITNDEALDHLLNRTANAKGITDKKAVNKFRRNNREKFRNLLYEGKKLSL